jgi:hypothetical protein
MERTQFKFLQIPGERAFQQPLLFAPPIFVRAKSLLNPIVLNPLFAVGEGSQAVCDKHTLSAAAWPESN